MCKVLKFILVSNSHRIDSSIFFWTQFGRPSFYFPTVKEKKFTWETRVRWQRTTHPRPDKTGYTVTSIVDREKVDDVGEDIRQGRKQNIESRYGRVVQKKRRRNE